MQVNNEKNLGADAAAVDTARSAEAVPQLSHAAPTLQEIMDALDRYDNASYAPMDIIRAANPCCDLLRSILCLIKSGDYALISRADRVSALRATRLATRHYDNDRHKEHDTYTEQALALLQLDQLRSEMMK